MNAGSATAGLLPLVAGAAPGAGGGSSGFQWEYLETVLFYLLFFLGATLATAVLGLVSSWIDRKVTALVQARKGPPPLQPFYDFVKLLGKEVLVPAGANRSVFLLMPLVALAGVSLAATILLGNVLWQNGLVGSYGFVGDVVVVLYLLVVPSLALVMGASSSNNPFASVGASREIKLMSYELPLLLAVAAALTLASAGHRRFSGEAQRQIDERLHAASPLVSAEASRRALRLKESALSRARAVLRTPPPRDGSEKQNEDLARSAEDVRRLPAEVDEIRQKLAVTGRRAGPMVPIVPLRLRELLLLRDAGPEKDPGVVLVRERIHQAAQRGLDVPPSDTRAALERLNEVNLAAAMRGDSFVRILSWATLAVCVLVVFMCVQAKLGLVPFDCAEADTEIAGGVLIEYGGPLLGVWKLVKAMLLFTLPVFLGVVFLGGFRFFVPDGVADGADVWQAVVSVLKYVLVLVFIVLVRNTNPRVRVDQAMRFFLGPMAFLAFVALFLAVVVHWTSM